MAISSNPGPFLAGTQSGGSLKEVHMRCLLISRGLVLSAAFLLLAACITTGCSSGTKAEAGAVATNGNAPAIGLSFSQTYLTIENHTGAPLVEGEAAIIPVGLMAPFRASLPRIEASGKQNVMFTRFRGSDGTEFRRGIARARRVRISATDINGKKYSQELPFN
jgi:hypothetical protein